MSQLLVFLAISAVRGYRFGVVMRNKPTLCSICSGGYNLALGSPLFRPGQNFGAFQRVFGFLISL